MGLDIMGVLFDNFWVNGSRSGKEVFLELEWMFEELILKVMGDVVWGKIEMIKEIDYYYVVEWVYFLLCDYWLILGRYGCYKEILNLIIVEVIEFFCFCLISKLFKVFFVIY